MSSKLKSNVSKELHANSKRVEPRGAAGGNAVLEEEIRRRAYEIYLERAVS